MASSPGVPHRSLREWDFVEEEQGVVWCLGRRQNHLSFEVVAAYRRSNNRTARKIHVDTQVYYERIMYHGLPEESSKIRLLPSAVRARIPDLLSGYDPHLHLLIAHCEYAPNAYPSPLYWLESTSRLAQPFQRSLAIALETVGWSNVPLEEIQIYGGAAFGLVNQAEQLVDDVDLLIAVTSAQMKLLTDKFQSPYTWSELNPGGLLSKRRLILKAKRWSTSQIRLISPYALSIDLKIPRRPGAPSLWDDVDLTLPGARYSGAIKVTHDDEVFSMSPAIEGSDETGQAVVVLMRGYSYIGCALVGDLVQVMGTRLGNTHYILVTQSAADTVMPDMRDVPVSE